LNVDYDATPEQILDLVMDSIEQSREHMMKGPHHWTSQKATNPQALIAQQVSVKS
jgi:hypothetical protein